MTDEGELCILKEKTKGKQMGFLKRAAVLLVISTCLSLFSCEGEGQDVKPNTRMFFEYFDTFGTLYDYSGASAAEFSRNADIIERELERCHKLFDIYNEYDGMNNLATLNKMAGKGAVELDGTVLDLLEYSVSMYEKTGGALNIAFGSVLKIWHAYRLEGKKVPSLQELSAANEHTDISCLVIDREGGTAELLDAQMSLDVGAVAKGYAVERVAELIKELGLTSYVLDMGGNLRAVGTKKNGEGWSSGIKNPLGSPEYIARIELSDSALVTSGTYERFYTVDGVSYHHIIDPDTLFPGDRYISLSVHAPSSALADALSTALFNMELSEVELFLKSNPDIGVVILGNDGKIHSFNA